MDHSQLGQRERATTVLDKAPPGSVGAAIRPMMEEAIRRLGLLGDANMAAGSIGDFYESNRELLYRPATDKNIEKFARRETRHFRTERDWFAWGVGLLLTEQDRARFIKDSRDELLRGGRGPRMPFNRFDAIFNPLPANSRFGFGPHGIPMGSVGSQSAFPTLGIGTSGLTSFSLGGFVVSGMDFAKNGIGSLGSPTSGLEGFGSLRNSGGLGIGTIGSSGLSSFGLGGFNTGLSTSSIGVGTIGSSGLSSFGLGGFNTGPSTSSSQSLGSSGGSPSTGGFNGSGR